MPPPTPTWRWSRRSGLRPDSGTDFQPRTGLIAGSGGASTLNQMEAIDTLREKGVKRIGPYRVTRTMGSTVSACLATPFQIKGVNYSISACATSAHCIGQAMEQIQLGKQDVVFAGGGEEEHWSQSCLFDAMGALSTQYNDTPEKASRAYDAKRDGHRRRRRHGGGRGAGACAQARRQDLRRDRRLRRHLRRLRHGRPSGEGAIRCMQQALATVDAPIDYLNTHGTSTGRRRRRDPRRARSVRSRRPADTKSLSATRWAPPACTRRSIAC